ncbi:MAG: response regulator [Hasllibacter sp.]
MDILIVEDDAALGQLWVGVARKAGHEATHVTGASAARKALLIQAYDLIVLDLNLGNDTGLSVVTLANYANPDCRVVVATGSRLFPRGELFTMDPSIVSVLRKPVPIDALAAVQDHNAAFLPPVVAAQPMR